MDPSSLGPRPCGCATISRRIKPAFPCFCQPALCPKALATPHVYGEPSTRQQAAVIPSDAIYTCAKPAKSV